MRRNITFNNVKKRFYFHKKTIIANVNHVLKSGQYLYGSENQKLTENLRSFFGGGLVTTVASGHDALVFALSALNLKPQDEVIFPVNAYPTAFAVASIPCTPVPIDCDENGQINLETIKKRLTKQTRTIVIVHLYGLVGNMIAIKAMAAKRKIPLIEDCAQSFGSVYRGKLTGTIGDIGCFSFYPSKNLSTMGDGGALITKKRSYQQFFGMMKMYGERKRYYSEFITGHSRLPEIQAAIINAQFKNINLEFQLRQRLYDYYRKCIEMKDLSKYIRLLESNKDSKPVIHLFTVEAKKRDKLQDFLKKNGVETGIYYPQPVHLTAAFKYLNYKLGDFPTTERLSKHLISLPFHPYMERNEVDYVVDRLKQFYARGNS